MRNIVIASTLIIVVASCNHNEPKSKQEKSESFIEKEKVNDDPISPSQLCDTISGFKWEQLRDVLGVKATDIIKNDDSAIYHTRLYYRGELFEGVVTQCNPSYFGRFSFKGGLLNGQVVEGNGDGVIEAKYYYRDGLKHGKYYSYEEGEINRIAVWQNGEKIKEWYPGD